MSKKNGSFIKITSNVIDEFKHIQKEHELNYHQIVVKILGFTTQYKMSDEDEWQICNKPLLESISEDEFLDKEFQFKQNYNILFEIKTDQEPSPIKFSIATNKNRTMVFGIFQKNDPLELDETASEKLKDAITKKLLLNGFIMGVWGENLEKEIKKFILMVKENKWQGQHYKMPLLKAIPPVLAVDAKMLMHNHESNLNNSIVEGVYANTLLFEYVHASVGKNGRDCFGHIMCVNKPIVFQDEITIDPTCIRKEETLSSTKYYSMVSGYLIQKGMHFSISNELQLQQAHFREGMIETGMDKDVNLRFIGREYLEDTVGSGVNIDVKSVMVNGTVGTNTKIQANDVNIAAQTHMHSKIYASESAKIKLHRGNLITKNAFIDVIESGRVEADTVHIGKIVGGEIIARCVYIKTLYSNAKITAQEKIEIDEIVGENNNLIINPLAIDTFREELTKLEIELEYETKKIHKYHNELEKRKSLIDNTKNKIDLANSTHINKMVIELNARVESSLNIATALEEKISALYDADLSGQIICHSIFNDTNKIVFVEIKNLSEHSIISSIKKGTFRLEKVNEEKVLVTSEAIIENQDQQKNLH